MVETEWKKGKTVRSGHFRQEKERAKRRLHFSFLLKTILKKRGGYKKNRYYRVGGKRGAHPGQGQNSSGRESWGVTSKDTLRDQLKEK